MAEQHLHSSHPAKVSSNGIQFGEDAQWLYLQMGVTEEVRQGGGRYPHHVLGCAGLQFQSQEQSLLHDPSVFSASSPAIFSLSHQAPKWSKAPHQIFFPPLTRHTISADREIKSLSDPPKTLVAHLCTSHCTPACPSRVVENQFSSLYRGI